jgi:hypothetical protein
MTLRGLDLSGMARIGMGKKQEVPLMSPSRAGRPPTASRGERPSSRRLQRGPASNDDDNNDAEDVLFARRRLQDVLRQCRDDGFASSSSSPSAAVACPGGGRGPSNFSPSPASSCFVSRYFLPFPVSALARATKRRGQFGPCGRCPLPCGPPAPSSFSCAVDRRLFRRPTRPPSCSLHDGGGAAPAIRPAGFGETTRPCRGWSGAGPVGAKGPGS